MKKQILISTILSLLLVLGLQAQDTSKKPLKGPAAKNYKPWKDANPSTAKVEPIKRVTGPEAKNKKPWNDAKPSEANVKPMKRITGPKAKNKKPWRDDD